MNPHQQNKIDTSSLSPDEQRLLRLYGKMPNKKDLLQNKLKERKYFDSGDYALSKAGKASDVGVTNIGSKHPVPENIPHLTATSPGANNPMTMGNGGSISAQGGQHIPGSISNHPGSVGFQSRSPIKEASFLHRGTSVNDSDNIPDPAENKEQDEGISPPPATEGVPIRR
ncbi:camp-regulated phosphoprotein/endosulfine conserved region-domain-containing protein [Aspergillus heterothallicus]